jgi:hypothetical protein
LYKHVEATKPSGKPFDLLNSYPRKTLSDFSQSIEGAGLKNAMLIQILK